MRIQLKLVLLGAFNCNAAARNVMIRDIEVLTNNTDNIKPVSRLSFARFLTGPINKCIN